MTVKIVGDFDRQPPIKIQHSLRIFNPPVKRTFRYMRAADRNTTASMSMQLTSVK